MSMRDFLDKQAGHQLNLTKEQEEQIMEVLDSKQFSVQCSIDEMFSLTEVLREVKGVAMVRAASGYPVETLECIMNCADELLEQVSKQIMTATTQASEEVMSETIVH